MASVRNGLSLFNVAATGDPYYSPLASFLRDERGAIPDGAYGQVWDGWLDLSLLWAAEPLRGRSYGKKLIGAAEDEATVQGCGDVCLSAFSFQAHPFRERFGNEVVSTIPDYPRGHAYHHLEKAL